MWAIYSMLYVEVFNYLICLDNLFYYFKNFKIQLKINKNIKCIH